MRTKGKTVKDESVREATGEKAVEAASYAVFARAYVVVTTKNMKIS